MNEVTLTGSPRILVAPWNDPIADAVLAGGGLPVADGDAVGLIWTDESDPEGLGRVLAHHGEIVWVQLVLAGVEDFRELFDRRRVWSCAKGVLAESVAAHALMLALAGLHGLGGFAVAESWLPPSGSRMYDANVVVVGGGEVSTALLRLLAPFRCRSTVVTRTGGVSVPGRRCVRSEVLDDVLPSADVVFLALALTQESMHLFDRRRLALMPAHAWIVNVARGRHIVTEDLVLALREGTIAGAALDVTDPEPLLDGHPLWAMSNCIVTPHVASTPDIAAQPIAAMVQENVRRFASGGNLLGRIDVDAGY